MGSIRARLALWYAGAFAVFLAAFSVAAYLFLDHTSLERVDEHLAETASAVGDALDFEHDQGGTDDDAIRGAAHEFRLRDIDVLILDRDRRRTLSSRPALERNATPGTRTPPGAPKPARRAAADGPDPSASFVRDLGRALDRAPGAPRALTLDNDGDDVRVFTLPYTLGSRRLVIGVAQSLRSRGRMLREAELALAFGIPVMLVLASLGGYALARKSLQPVMDMSGRAAAIGATTLHERLPVRNPNDELGRLAAVFNQLLGRLELSFEQQRRFMADASHELRTPVAVISAESEFALERVDRSAEDLRDALRVVRGEGRRLHGIVDDLFLLARADAGERPLRPESLYLGDLLQECARATRALAAARDQEFVVELGSDDMPLVGDEALLKRLVGNLLDNAVKYSPRKGRVTLRAGRQGDEFRVDVADTGPGVSSHERDRIFDRFYRSDSARTAEGAEGAGIGLAIAKWVARAHGGDVLLQETGARGSIFRIVLPVRGDVVAS